MGFSRDMDLRSYRNPRRKKIGDCLFGMVFSLLGIAIIYGFPLMIALAIYSEVKR